MDIEDIIQVIVNNGRVEDMNKLSSILEDTLEIINQYDKECFKKYEMELYKMAYGTTLTKEMAEEIVSRMRPYRMKWSIEETEQIKERYGINNIRPVDFFIVLNSSYNDFYDIFGDNLDMYVKYTIDFIEDEDAKPDKVFLYYTTIPE